MIKPTHKKAANEVMPHCFKPECLRSVYYAASHNATAEIIQKYNIAPNSKLAHVIGVTNYKLALVLHENRARFTEWYNRDENEDIRNALYNSPAHEVSDFDREFIAKKFMNGKTDPLFDRLLKIEYGRHKVVINAYAHFMRHINDAPNRTEFDQIDEGKKAMAILGSLIRRVIDLDSEAHPNFRKVNFSRVPKATMEIISALRAA